MSSGSYFENRAEPEGNYPLLDIPSSRIHLRSQAAENSALASMP